MTNPTHQPKGGMCAVCKHRLKDCSGLDFEGMKVIGSYEGVKIVRCDGFERGEAIMTIKAAEQNEAVSGLIERLVMFFTWQYRVIAGQPHRKRSGRVQAMFLGEWCDVPFAMWDFKT